MSFTDGKPRVATEADIKMQWSGGKPGQRFRCYLCGHKFAVGDTWRFLYMNGTPGVHCGNALVCEKCDGPDAVERMAAHAKAWAEFREKDAYWWAR